jgi:hypothetical protein
VKKTILLSLALMGSLNAFEGVDTQEAETVITDQTIVNTVVNNPVATFTNIIDSKKSGSVAGDVIVSGNVKMVNLPLAYKFNPSWGFSAAVPYVETNFVGDVVEKGIGDISASINYIHGKAKSDMQTVELRYKSDTGDYLIGTGSGAESLFTGYSIRKLTKKYTLVGSASYTHNESYTNDTLLNYPIVYGDTMSLNFGLTYESFLSKKIKTTIRFSYMDKNSDTQGGTDANNGLTNSDLWLSMSTDKFFMDLPIKWGLKIPLEAKSDSATARVDKTVLFYASVAGYFDK